MSGFVRPRPLLLTALVAVTLFGLASIAVVPDTRQAVVMRLGQPMRVENSAAARANGGLVLHWPLIEWLVGADRRVEALNVAGIAVHRAGGQDLSLDAAVHWRVIDPARMVAEAGSEVGLAAALKAAVAPAFAAVSGRPDAPAALERVRARLNARARSLGGQVLDVALVRAAPTGASLAEALARMRTVQDGQALQVQADGARAAQAVTAQGEADANARIVRSAGQDPEFYAFYRAMKSYDATLAQPGDKHATTIILAPDSEYLRQMKGRSSARP